MSPKPLGGTGMVVFPVIVGPVEIWKAGALSTMIVELAATSLNASYLPDCIRAEIIASGTVVVDWGTRSTRGSKWVRVVQPVSDG